MFALFATSSQAPQPTASPTIPPITTIPMEAGQVIEGPAGIGFGTSLTFTSTRLTVGAPNATSGGAIFSYESDEGSFIPVGQVSGPNEGAEFGISVDANSQGSLIVGSPEALPLGKSISTGSATYYTFNAGSSSWVAQGSAFVGGESRDNARERFGSAVAISSTAQRAVVGAPLYAEGLGRVYMYSLSGGQWTPMDQQELRGRSTGSSLGSAVDISTDGTVVAAGAPGEDSFSVYEWLGNQWVRTLREEGPAGSAMGDSVAVLSDSFIAVGLPTARSNRGVVRLYVKTEGEWNQLSGSDNLLVGGANERIGRSGTLTGSVSPDGDPQVTFAAGQTVRRFDYISGRWGERFTIDTGMDISSVAIEEGLGPVTVWVGDVSSNQVAEFKQVLTAAPTKRLTAEPTIQPTPSPTITARPTSSTKPPTSSPTSAPTGFPDGAGWQVFSGPFSGVAPNIGYGTSVAMDGDLMCTGAPGFSGGVGAVEAFRKSGTRWESFDTEIVGSARDFGSAIDISAGPQRTSLIVGAPGTVDEDQFTTLSFGSAHYYEYDGSEWSAVGSPLRPDIDLFTSGGEYGYSVAVSANAGRIAVGAPRITLDEGTPQNGRVFTYTIEGGSFVPLGNIDGPASGERYGHALAMTADGTRLLVGAPNTDSEPGNDEINMHGAIYYYSWNADQGRWRQIFNLPGSTPSENLGSSVAILASNGNTIAMSAPNFDGGRGAIRVYRLEDPNVGFWSQLGEDIVGEPGENLGTSLSGFNNRVVASTTTGTFKVFDYNTASTSWTQVDEEPDTGSQVLSVATGSTGDIVVGQASGEVAFYQLF